MKRANGSARRSATVARAHRQNDRQLAPSLFPAGRNSRALSWLTPAIQALAIVRRNDSEMLRPSRELELFRPERPGHRQRNVVISAP
jgi:hypothetical protein